MQCQGCGFNTEETHKFCPECGTKLSDGFRDSALHFDGNPIIEVAQQIIDEPKKASSKQAIISFFFSIAGCVGYCICCPSFLFSIAAIVLGIRSLNSDKKGFAIAGIVLGFVGVFIPLIIGLLLFFSELIFTNGTFPSQFYNF